MALIKYLVDQVTQQPGSYSYDKASGRYFGAGDPIYDYDKATGKYTQQGSIPLPGAPADAGAGAIDTSVITDGAKKGGVIKNKSKAKSKSASSRADGIAQRGKTRGRMV